MQQYPAITGFPTQRILKVIDYKGVCKTPLQNVMLIIAGGEALSKFLTLTKRSEAHYCWG